jgi:two-component system alkaline phosphatase synthesis response regulator PhoP
MAIYRRKGKVMSKKKILLVDDDPYFLEAVQEVVEAAGYEVDVACDGEEALEKVARDDFDLIVLDVMMPVMNGHQACKRLKEDPATSEIPIILLTAVGDQVTSTSYSHRDMMASDAEDYLPKPVEPAELLERIDHLL